MGMKNKALILASGLSLLLFIATVEPLRWPNAYVDWRGKLHRPDWRSFNADDGTSFLVDIKSIKTLKAPGGDITMLVAYRGDVSDFEPEQLIQYAVDCKVNFVEVVSRISLEQMRRMNKKLNELGCAREL